jgi:hypothetical protein
MAADRINPAETVEGSASERIQLLYSLTEACIESAVPALHSAGMC